MTACQKSGQAVHFVRISEWSHFHLRVVLDYVIRSISNRRLSGTYCIGNQAIRFNWQLVTCSFPKDDVLKPGFQRVELVVSTRCLCPFNTLCLPESFERLDSVKNLYDCAYKPRAFSRALASGVCKPVNPLNPCIKSIVLPRPRILFLNSMPVCCLRAPLRANASATLSASTSVHK